MQTPFTWLSKTQAITALQNRLNAGSFWSPDELFLYIQEGLRIRNALCEEWRPDFVFLAQGCTWNNIGTMTGSPRMRTVTDTDLYTEMQYHLLEPPTGGGAWTGTNQFSLAKLQYALSNRRNEVIQAMPCNLVNLDPIVAGSTDRKFNLPDTTLETRRIRYLMLILTTTASSLNGGNVLLVGSYTGLTNNMVVTGAGIPSGTSTINVVPGAVTISIPTTAALNNTVVQFYQVMTLTREDTQGFQDFNPGYLQDSGIPQSWSVISDPPLEFAVDKALILPGQMDVILLQSGPAFAPPASTPMGIPDDWCWLAKYGALADLLDEEAESTDRQRASYCRKRLDDGLKMFKDSNWLLQATVNNVACDTPSLYDKDWSLAEWQNLQGQIPGIVQDGIDFVAVTPNTPSSASLTLVANAPILDSSGTYVQVTRDAWDSVLGYAHHAATFKLGGDEFVTTASLLDDFFGKCQHDNSRVSTYGLYSDILLSAGQEQERTQSRWATTAEPTTSG